MRVHGVEQILHIKKQPLPIKNQIFTTEFAGISKKHIHLAINLKIQVSAKLN